MLSKKISKIEYDWDDYIILLALINDEKSYLRRWIIDVWLSTFHFGFEHMSHHQWNATCQEIKCNVYNVITDVHHGFGQHAATLPLDDIILTLKLIYCAEIFYVLAINFIKLFVLLFYRRIFPNERFEIVLWCIKNISRAWIIVISLSFVFKCSPVAKAWDFSLDDWCINIDKLICDNAVPKIVIDVFILMTPLPLFWRLKMTLHQKLTVCRFFLMGGLLIYELV